MIGCLLWLIMSASGNMFKCQDSDFEEVTRMCPLVAGEGNHFCVPFLGLRCHAVVGPYSYCEKLPQTSDIKHHKFILSQFWRPEILNQGISSATLSLEALGRESISHFSPSFW